MPTVVRHDLTPIKMINIPNILTAFRIFLIPVFVLCYYLPIESAGFWAALTFVLAAVTDYFDGYLARKLEQQTAFGAFLDPVADKVMVAAALVMVSEQYVSIWVTLPAVIMISREIIISALREWMAQLGKRASVAVSWVGKWKTAAQMMALIGLIWNPVGWIETLAMVLLYIATVLTLWSMCSYLLAATRELTKEGTP